MSIKNIIQQENDLQEMSPRSLANYLNNPTGQYNPYLVAGELQRKEAFAQRQMTEAPQETVVDELVAQAMPMGKMPMGGMSMGGMPMPRPEEVMVSDTITETGIANLPAPNIGQNYAGGGIVEYDNGGEVGFFDKIKDFGRERLSGLEAGLDERTARHREQMRIYEETGEFPPMSEQDLDDALSVSGLGGIAKVGGKAMPYIKDTAKKAADYIKNKIKPSPKKLNKKQKAQKIKDDKAKAKAAKEAPKKGPLTQKVIEGAKYVGPRIGPGIRGLGRGLKNYPVEAGLGAYGAYKAYDYFDPFGTKEEAARLKEEKTRQTLADQAKREADEAAYNAKVQAELDAAQAARDRQREKEAYLALALGGAKTMAGQSPFALANIGEGLGAGVGALAAYDQNEMERMAASQAASAKAQQDMRIALMDYEMKYYERVNKLADNQIYNARLKQIEDNEEGLVDEDVAKLKEALLIEFAGLDPQSYIANINGQQFTAAE